MRIAERTIGDVTILDLAGNITADEGAEALRAKINALAFGQRLYVILNLVNVPFIDSSGLGQIVRAYTSLKCQGGRLTVINPTRRVRELLAIARLEAILSPCGSETEALQEFLAHSSV